MDSVRLLYLKEEKKYQEGQLLDNNIKLYSGIALDTIMFIIISIIYFETRNIFSFKGLLGLEAALFTGIKTLKIASLGTLNKRIEKKQEIEKSIMDIRFDINREKIESRNEFLRMEPVQGIKTETSLIKAPVLEPITTKSMGRVLTRNS